MNFYKAWASAKTGYGMRRTSWPKDKYLVYIQGPDIQHGGAFMRYDKPGTEYIPNHDEILAIDWEVINRANNTTLRD